MSGNKNSDTVPPSAAGAPAPAAHRWPARLRAVAVPYGLALCVVSIVFSGIHLYWSANQDYFRRFGSLDTGAAATAADARAAWGQYGDYLGGRVNPGLSALTLLALAITIWLQMRQVAMGREQLDLSRHELELTRRELERSADAQREAADAMKGQMEQARLTALAQTEAALHQLATAKAMEQQVGYAKQATQIQALNAAVDLLGRSLTGIQHGNQLVQALRTANENSTNNMDTVLEVRNELLVALMKLVAGLTPPRDPPHPGNQGTTP